MTDDLNHGHSERLAAFAAGELDAAEAARVDAHVAGCDECRAELEAVVALRSLPAEGLTADERARLHARVWSALGGAREDARRPRRRWAARLAPAFAAAALLAIAGAGLSLLSGDDLLTIGGAQRGADDAGAAAEDRAFEESAEDQESEPRRPLFVEIGGEANAADLRALAARAPDVPRPPPGEREANAKVLLGRIEASAPDPATARLVRRCGRVALERRPGLLPLAGARARRDGEPVLVLTFASPRRGAKEVWAWRAGSCSAPLLLRGPGPP